MNTRALIVVATVAVGILADLVTGYSPVPGYGALLGLVGGAGMIIGSKWLGNKVLRRSGDYYPQDGPAQDAEDLRG